jgi:iron complex transport system permease protein
VTSLTAAVAPVPPPGTARLAARGRSLLLPVRPALAVVVLVALLVAVCAVSLAVGSAGLRPARALAAAFGQGQGIEVVLVQRLRLPRLQAGLLVGAALGVAGLLLQVVARNRLATPGNVGIDDGATAFAVASVVGVTAAYAPSGMALAGAATACALALGLAGGAGSSGYRFLVVGLGVGAVLGAITSLLLVRAPIDAANAAFPWSVGSLSARPPGPVRLLAIGLALALPAAVLVGRRLALLRLPDGVATSLGARVPRVRLAALAVAVVCAGLAVAVGGPLGTVALVAPAAARRLAGPRGVPVVGAALAGALLVVAADLAGRTVAAPVEVPVGLVTALVGSPYLIWLLLSPRSLKTP